MLGICALSAVPLSTLHASSLACVPATATGAAIRRGEWTAPLDRRLSVHGGEVSLRVALDRVAAAGRIRLSYSDALLPLERRVCLELDGVALGDALRQLVADDAIAPRVAGSNLVVLALAPDQPPRRVAVARPLAEPLERVVVTGTATGGAQRSLTVAVGVVDGIAQETLAQNSLGAFLNGGVPGVWIWQQSPTSLTTRYASIRGASSFGVSFPKMYLDGVELANPLVMTHLPAESIERVEVLRGPQGAALYGTDAISGVVQLVTRQPIGADATNVRMRAQGTTSNSLYTETGAIGQELLVSGQVGSIARSATGTVGLSRLGAIIPGGESSHLTATGRARALFPNAIVEATARLAVADVASSSNPIVLQAVGDAFPQLDSIRNPVRQQRVRDSLAARLNLDGTQRQSLRQFTTGVTATVHPSERWTHRATVGVDAYSLDGPPGSITPLPSSSDSALRAANGSAMRASARASSAATWSDADWTRTLTLSAEHAVLEEASTNAVLLGPRQRVELVTQAEVWRQTTGGVAQLDLAWRNTVFLTGGARVERSAGFTSEPLVTLLPMLGASVVGQSGLLTLKGRAAYGKGIRPPRTTVGGASIGNQRLLPNPDLGVEEQSGTEIGVDLFLGGVASFHATRFDQLASGLVQPVTVLGTPATTGPVRPGDPLGRNLAFQMQNVGAISNSGWELASLVRRGPLSVQASLGLVDSRVDVVRRGYSGELRPGDRMLDVPARTLGVSARWEVPTWSAAVQLSRAEDWIGYDRIAASAAYARPGNTASNFLGASLREFWMVYPGVTRLNATITRALPANLVLHFAGHNLLNYQTGEPDNISIVPGRTLSLGVRARF